MLACRGFDGNARSHDQRRVGRPGQTQRFGGTAKSEHLADTQPPRQRLPHLAPELDEGPRPQRLVVNSTLALDNRIARQYLARRPLAIRGPGSVGEIGTPRNRSSAGAVVARLPSGVRLNCAKGCFVPYIDFTTARQLRRDVARHPGLARLAIFFMLRCNCPHHVIANSNYDWIAFCSYGIDNDIHSAVFVRKNVKRIGQQLRQILSYRRRHVGMILGHLLRRQRMNRNRVVLHAHGGQHEIPARHLHGLLLPSAQH